MQTKPNAAPTPAQWGEAGAGWGQPAWTYSLMLRTHEEQDPQMTQMDADTQKRDKPTAPMKMRKQFL